MRAATMTDLNMIRLGLILDQSAGAQNGKEMGLRFLEFNQVPIALDLWTLSTISLGYSHHVCVRENRCGVYVRMWANK